ncbi:MAG: CBS domain-containing protein [Candidatus Margulisiibacteriota bacterium]|jgi:flagellar motility protein MotE (MotC chaperone)
MKELANKGIFLSQILEKYVWSADRKAVGKLKDIAVDMNVTFPKVLGLIIDLPFQRENEYLAITACETISEKEITLKTPLSNIKYENLPEGCTLLKQNILDKQIVDVNNIRVVRVNDIKLIKVEDGFRFVAVDCGLTGILRRLKMLGTAKLIPFIGGKITERTIAWSSVQPMQSDTDDLRLKETYEKIFNLHPADIAEILSLVHHEERTAIVESLSEENLAEVLPYLEDAIKADIIENMHLDRAVEVIEEMPMDEAVDILGDVSDEKAHEILDQMEPEETEEFQELLQHHDDTAGGLMNSDHVAFTQDLTVASALAKLREMKPDEEMFSVIYVVDKQEHLLGVFSLQTLVLAEPEQILQDIMDEKVVKVEAGADKEEIGELVAKYSLITLPVVDKNNILQGVITVDDVVEHFIPSGFKKKRDVMA